MLSSQGNLFHRLPSESVLETARWEYRLLLVLFAEDAYLDSIRPLWEPYETRTGAAERDLLFLFADPGLSEAIARRFRIAPGQPTTVLIGKDGAAKLVTRNPVGPEQIFPLIDAMPMRQREMAAD